jgi:hypothetical protein
MSALQDTDLGELLLAVWQAGYYDGQQATRGESTKAVGSGGCGCSGTK